MNIKLVINGGSKTVAALETQTGSTTQQIKRVRVTNRGDARLGWNKLYATLVAHRQHDGKKRDEAVSWARKIMAELSEIEGVHPDVISLEDLKYLLTCTSEVVILADHLDVDVILGELSQQGRDLGNPHSPSANPDPSYVKSFFTRATQARLDGTYQGWWSPIENETLPIGATGGAGEAGAVMPVPKLYTVIVKGSWSDSSGIVKGHTPLYVGQDLILDWVPATRDWRVWAYNRTITTDNPLTKLVSQGLVRQGRWSTITTGHELIWLGGNRVLDWVPADGGYRLWRFDPKGTKREESPSKPDVLDSLPAPMITGGNWVSIRANHKLIWLGDDHVLDWIPADGDYRIWRFDRRETNVIDPFPGSPLAIGTFASMGNDHQLIYVGGDYLMDWIPTEKIAKFWRYNRKASPPTFECKPEASVYRPELGENHRLLWLGAGQLLAWETPTDTTSNYQIWSLFPSAEPGGFSPEDQSPGRFTGINLNMVEKFPAGVRQLFPAKKDISNKDIPEYVIGVALWEEEQRQNDEEQQCQNDVVALLKVRKISYEGDPFADVPISIQFTGLQVDKENTITGHSIRSVTRDFPVSAVDFPDSTVTDSNHEYTATLEILRKDVIDIYQQINISGEAPLHFTYLRAKIPSQEPVMESAGLLYPIIQHCLFFLPGVLASEIRVVGLQNESVELGQEAFPKTNLVINNVELLVCHRNGMPYHRAIPEQLKLLETYFGIDICEVYDKVKEVVDIFPKIYLNGPNRGAILEHIKFEAVPYDWRLCLDASTPSFAFLDAMAVDLTNRYAKIDKEYLYPFLAKKLSLAGHSTGGILMRGLLSGLLSNHTLLKPGIEEAFFLNVPFWGAPKGEYALLTGDMGLKFLGMPTVGSEESFRQIGCDLPVTYILSAGSAYGVEIGINKKDANGNIMDDRTQGLGWTIADRMRRVQQAIENGAYILEKNKSLYNIEHKMDWITKEGQLGFNERLAERAQAYYDACAKVKPKVKTYVFHSFGENTIYQSKMTKPVTAIWGPIGDGTVPTISQIADLASWGGQVTLMRPIPGNPIHMEVPNSVWVWRQILDVLCRKSLKPVPSDTPYIQTNKDTKDECVTIPYPKDANERRNLVVRMADELAKQLSEKPPSESKTIQIDASGASFEHKNMTSSLIRIKCLSGKVQIQTHIKILLNDVIVNQIEVTAGETRIIGVGKEEPIIGSTYRLDISSSPPDVTSTIELDFISWHK